MVISEKSPCGAVRHAGSLILFVSLALAGISGLREARDMLHNKGLVVKRCTPTSRFDVLILGTFSAPFSIRQNSRR